MLATSSSAKLPLKVSPITGFLNCDVNDHMVIGKAAAMAAAGGICGIRLFMLLMRSDSLRLCIIEVENRRGFSSRGFVRAMEAAEAIAARK